MEALAILAVFVHLIVLFKFFEMSRDVWKLRNKVGSQEPLYWLNDYNKSMYLGRNEKALFALQEFVWYSMQKRKDKKAYEALREKYHDDFRKLGGEFPIY